MPSGAMLNATREDMELCVFSKGSLPGASLQPRRHGGKTNLNRPTSQRARFSSRIAGSSGSFGPPCRGEMLGVGLRI